MMMSFEKQMDFSNDLAGELIRSLNKKSETYPEETPDVVLLYGAVFAMIEIADQLNTPKKFLLNVVESALKNQAQDKALYKKLRS